MKTTQYFWRNRTEKEREWIEIAWVQSVMDDPVHVSVQSDGRFRLRGPVPEFGGRYLRVVLLPDNETVHNAFFDNGFRP